MVKIAFVSDSVLNVKLNNMIKEPQSRVPEVVHQEGTSRAQALRHKFNPRNNDLMKEMERLIYNGVVLTPR